MLRTLEAASHGHSRPVLTCVNRRMWLNFGWPGPLLQLDAGYVIAGYTLANCGTAVRRHPRLSNFEGAVAKAAISKEVLAQMAAAGLSIAFPVAVLPNHRENNPTFPNRILCSFGALRIGEPVSGGGGRRRQERAPGHVDQRHSERPVAQRRHVCKVIGAVSDQPE